MWTGSVGRCNAFVGIIVGIGVLLFQHPIFPHILDVNVNTSVREQKRTGPHSFAGRLYAFGSTIGPQLRLEYSFLELGPLSEYLQEST